ncbi:hypothetical protein MRX96_030360 [Rhipicephalus microplus]
METCCVAGADTGVVVRCREPNPRRWRRRTLASGAIFTASSGVAVDGGMAARPSIPWASTEPPSVPGEAVVLCGSSNGHHVTSAFSRDPPPCCSSPFLPFLRVHGGAARTRAPWQVDDASVRPPRSMDRRPYGRPSAAPSSLVTRVCLGRLTGFVLH